MEIVPMKKKQSNNYYYNLAEMDKIGAKYKIIYGERSNGKTSALLVRILENYVKDKKQAFYFRRFMEDFKTKFISELFTSICFERKIISQLTAGEWDRVYYQSQKWYLAKYDNDLAKIVHEENPFMFGLALNSWEHAKGSTGYPDVTTVVYDEFLSKTSYLQDEYIMFFNAISTIVRERSDCTVYMVGNSVQPYSPYFREMGLKHINEMIPGDLKLYRYSEKHKDAVVAVEYSDSASKYGGKDSDVFFMFDNPKLNMITNGGWEIANYPHCPMKYDKKDIVYLFFVKFDDAVIQGDVVNKAGCLFIFFHLKNTPIYDDKYPIYEMRFDPKPNCYISLTAAYDKRTQKIAELVNCQKLFFQDNQIGNLISNYIIESGRYSLLKL